MFIVAKLILYLKFLIFISAGRRDKQGITEDPDTRTLPAAKSTKSQDGIGNVVNVAESDVQPVDIEQDPELPSYVDLIKEAIVHNPFKKATLETICSYIKLKYPVTGDIKDLIGRHLCVENGFRKIPELRDEGWVTFWATCKYLFHSVCDLANNFR